MIQKYDWNKFDALQYRQHYAANPIADDNVGETLDLYVTLISRRQFKILLQVAIIGGGVVVGLTKLFSIKIRCSIYRAPLHYLAGCSGTVTIISSSMSPNLAPNKLNNFIYLESSFKPILEFVNLF